jgi:hypothetical protein
LGASPARNVFQAIGRLRAALEKTGLTGNLQSSTASGDQKATAITILRHAAGEITQHIIDALVPVDNLLGLGALPCFAKDNPLRFELKSLKKLWSALEILKQEAAPLALK